MHSFAPTLYTIMPVLILKRSGSSDLALLQFRILLLEGWRQSSQLEAGATLESMASILKCHQT